jgi:purine-nucleoside phosphorylase
MPVHLRADPADYASAVLVPGDPKRARYMAETFFDPGARCVNDERGMLGFTGTYRGTPISVQSVGMGGPSAGIYYNELIQLGATRIVRVGTAGGLADNLQMADTIVCLSGTPDDPSVAQLTDGEPHAPTGDWRLIELSARLAREQGATVHVGSVVSSALFYDTRQGQFMRWKQRGHLAVEMEVATLYTLAAIHRIEAVALVTVSDLIEESGNVERISDEDLQRGVDRMMAVACDVAIAELD